jgi:endo-1,4-beta-xylanase
LRPDPTDGAAGVAGRFAAVVQYVRALVRAFRDNSGRDAQILLAGHVTEGADPMRASVIFSGAAVFLALAGCAPAGSGEASQTGGTTGTGGQNQPGSGGSGSSGSVGSGGTPSSGGTTGSGGATGTGGVTATGGASSSGGSSAHGGTTGSGGITRNGGTTGSGGTTSSGGTIGSGGASASGGATASGGAMGSGGLTGTGGASATGGGAGRDAGSDARSSPDAEPACTPGDTCTEADKTVTSGSGKHCCYTYENWVGSGSATMTLKTDGFSVNWTGSTQFVGREGIRPGSGNLVTQYNATFTPNGNGYLCLYGWTTDPLVEYYVLDSWGSYKPPGGSSLGTVTSDGGTYDIYKSTRTNQPSIQGTATFPQYWSVRQQKRTSGTITLANHIAAWAGKGMPMGTFYEVSMTVEGYQSNGTADVKFTMK